MDIMTWNSRRELIYDAVYQILNDKIGCGRFDGGCLIIAHALQSVIGGAVVVLVDINDNADHAAVLSNGFLWDFDAPLKPDDFITRFNNLERRSCVGYRSIQLGDLKDAPIDADCGEEMIKLFTDMLGDAPHNDANTKTFGI